MRVPFTHPTRIYIVCSIIDACFFYCLIFKEIQDFLCLFLISIFCVFNSLKRHVISKGPVFYDFVYLASLIIITCRKRSLVLELYLYFCSRRLAFLCIPLLYRLNAWFFRGLLYLWLPNLFFVLRLRHYSRLNCTYNIFTPSYKH